MNFGIFFQFVFIIISLTIFSCSDTNPQEIRGLWKLFSMETRDSITGDWDNYKGGMQGYLMYDGVDNMSLYLSTKDYEKTDLEFANFNDTISIEKLKYLTGSYYYLGKYEVNEESNTVTHKRLAHSNPNDWGKSVNRKFQFKEDTLIITPEESKNSRLRLKWLQENN